MDAFRLPAWRLASGILAVAGSAAFATQWFMERREGDGDVTTRAIVLLTAALALLAIALLSILPYRAATSALDLKRRISLDLRELPFAGRGLGFFSALVASGLGFAVLAHIGEDGLDRGDVVAWIGSALLVALCAAIAAWFAARVLPEIVTAIFVRLLSFETASPRFSRLERFVVPLAFGVAWPPTLFKRPPPLQA